MKINVLLVVLFFCLGLLYANPVKLELVKTIGDERDDYTFFSITGAVVSPEKDIYVLDTRGGFVAKYDWEGKFLGRTGRKGKGPGDLYYPRAISYFNGKIYLLDRGNRRIAEISPNLEKFDYFKLPTDGSFDSNMVPLGNGRFLGNFTTYQKKRGRLGIVDKKGQTVGGFFNGFPIPVDIKDGDKNDVYGYGRMIMLNSETTPIFAVDDKRENILVSFKQPDNPIRFFLHDIKGNELKSFSYEIPEKEYKFCDYFVKSSIADIMAEKNIPAESHRPWISSLLIHKGYFLVSLSLDDYKKKEVSKSREFLLVLDKNGKVKERLSVDSSFNLCSITPDGYLLAGQTDEDDVSKLCIYKLTL